MEGGGLMPTLEDLKDQSSLNFNVLHKEIVNLQDMISGLHVRVMDLQKKLDKMESDNGTSV